MAMGKRARRRLHVLSVVMIVAGLLAVVTPFVSERVYNRRQTEALQEFVADTPDGDATTDGLSPLLQSLWDLMDARNKAYAANPQAVYASGGTDPDDIDLAAYGLDCVGYIEIPSVGETLPIVLGAGADQLALGAGHMTGTSYPIGGPSTNSCLAAHRGWYWSYMWRNLDYASVGDVVYVHNFKETLNYRVSAINVVSPTDASLCEAKEGKDLLTLITCEPKWQTPRTKRLVLTCERVP